MRDELGYPPVARLVRVLFEDTDLERADAGGCLSSARSPCASSRLRGTSATILGPGPRPDVAILRGRHRQHLLLKLPHDGAVHDRALTVLRARAAKGARPRLAIDVDPVGLL